MKKYIPLLITCLLVCLFIYVFYRTEKTLINQVVIALFSADAYYSLKVSITSQLPLNKYIIYSLPEGLWIFCITIASGPFYLKICKQKLCMVYIPLLVAILMEIFQLLKVTNGRFDITDIIFAYLFWMLALILTKNRLNKEPFLKSFNIEVVFCALSYSIVYLAHVSY